MATKAKSAGKSKDNEPLKRLKQALSAGTVGNLYFFFGEEDYLRDYYLGQMKKTLLGTGGMESFNLHEFHGSACTARTLSEAVDCLPMMGERTLIVVYDFDVFKSPADEQKAYAQLFSTLPEYVCVVFVYDLINIDRRVIKGDLGKLIKGTEKLVQFNRQSEHDLTDWIARRFKAMGKSIGKSEAEHLIFVSGGMMTGLAQEIEKIGSYAKGAFITAADIDAVAAPVLDAVVFKMTEHLSVGRFDDAARVLSELFVMQEPLPMILGAIGHSIRQLYTARLAVEQGRDAAWLVEIWSMKQSWSAEKLLRNARHFSGDWYRRAVRLVGETDRALKLSYNEGEALLTQLLVRLAEGC